MTKQDIEIRRGQGMTYQQIGNEFGVTRQRVHQIYKDYFSSHPETRSTVREKKLGKAIPLPRFTLYCKKCKNPFLVVERELPIRKHCSNECRGRTVKINCKVCGKEKTIKEYKLLRGAKYCSLKCRAKGHTQYNDRLHRQKRIYSKWYVKNNPEKVKKSRHETYLKRKEKLSTGKPLKQANKQTII